MKIIYEDRDIIVVYKEAGLPVQTGRTSGMDLVSLLMNHLAQETAERTAASQLKTEQHPSAAQPKTGQHQAAAQQETKRPSAKQPEIKAPYLGIIHRLDQPVEGLLVFAKTPKAAASLSRQAAAKGSPGEADAAPRAGRPGKKPEDPMEKTYRAVVLLSNESFPLALEGRKHWMTLTDWLLRDASRNMSLVTEQGAQGAKRAELSFRTLEIRDRRAMVEIRLHTGRHHQIRVQMAHAGMPLAGDRKYGGQAAGILQQEAQPAAPERYDAQHRLCLCASELGFTHPATGKRMTFQVEPGFSL